MAPPGGGVVPSVVGVALPGGGEVPAEVRRDLRSRFASTRARAVRRLGQLPGQEAWELVVRALADPDGEVGEQAQLLVRRETDPRRRAGLLGADGLRSSRGAVARRVAEALGHWRPGPSPAELERALGRLEGAARVALVVSIERLARAGALEVGRQPALARSLARLVQMRSSREPLPPRGEALLALRALDPEGARALALEVEASGDPRLRIASLLCSTEPEPGDALVPGPGLRPLSSAGLARARLLAGDSDVRVRRAVVRALGATRTRSAAALLADRLEVEPRTRLRTDLVAALRRLSGLRHGADPRPWRAWVRGLRAEQLPRPADLEHGGGRAPAGAVTSSGAEPALPLGSDRAAALIDLSGSVQRELQGGRTRKDLIDEVVLATLEGLAAGAVFQLVPFTAEPRLLPEIPEAVRPRLANRWAQDYLDLRLQGPGDLWEAVEVALPQRDLDTLVLLTDGAPTAAFHHEVDLFVEQLLVGLRLDPVALELVLVDAGPALARRWEPLAQATGGALQLRRFPPLAEGARR